MRIDRIELENRARIERSRAIAAMIADGLVAIQRFVRQAWHASVSDTPRTVIK